MQQIFNISNLIFTGKSVDTGEWVFGYFIKNNFNGDCFICRDHWTEIKKILVYEKSIGIFTNKLDRNKKKIFTGDLIYLPISDQNDEFETFKEYEIYLDSNLIINCYRELNNDIRNLEEFDDYEIEILGKKYDKQWN